MVSKDHMDPFVNWCSSVDKAKSVGLRCEPIASRPAGTIELSIDSELECWDSLLHGIALTVTWQRWLFL